MVRHPAAAVAGLVAWCSTWQSTALVSNGPVLGVDHHHRGGNLGGRTHTQQAARAHVGSRGATPWKSVPVVGQVSSSSRQVRRRPVMSATLDAPVSTAQQQPASEAPANPEKKRILILMSDTGGGHRASAQALAHALGTLYPSQIDCEILDIWTEHAPWPYKKFVPWYAYVAKRPMLWRALWSYARFPLTRRVQEAFTRIQCQDRFEEVFRDRLPLDAVVSVHPLCQNLPLRVMRKLDEETGSKTPFVTVVTDLASAHPTWFHKGVDACFVPTDRIAQIAKRVGLRDEKLVQHGLPLRQAFWRPETRSKEQLREDLGLPKHLDTALIVGGGDGVGRIANTAKAIAKELADNSNSGAEKSLVVVCGRNVDAQAELEAYDWPDNVRATILGFVPNMDEFMAAADCLVTKAGPGTIAEASTRGLPTLLSSYLPGQEAGNVKYVTRDKKFGVFSRRPKRIAKTVRTWLDDRQTRDRLSQQAMDAAQLDATTNIARDIAAFLFPANASLPHH